MPSDAPTSFSYQGQDRFVVRVLNGLRGGFFLDSGASNGVSGSNSLLLETNYGWQGICVEPNDGLFARLTSSRQCICVNCCLYDREGDVAFFEAAGVLGGILDTYDPGHLQYARSVVGPSHNDDDDRSDGIVTKGARPIRSVLREFGAPNVIDYWSLDTEGSELSILKSFPYDEYTVRVITVEHNFTSARSDIRRFLEARGYHLAEPLGIDDGYVLDAPWGEQAWRSAAWRARLSPNRWRGGE
jgi:Methyltransferase FkbM domain